MKIISISGLDGSGKSTQAQMLQTYLENKGQKVLYFHAIAFSFPQRIKEFRKKYCPIYRLTKGRKKNEATEEKSVTKANCLQIKLRKFAFIIDVIRFKFFKRKLARKGYDFIITDRYFYDTIVNIAYLEHRNTPPSIEKYIPKADAAFYLKIQPESIMTRDRVPDQGLQYLKDKKKLYDMYAVLWNFKIIDGSKDKEVLHKEIKEFLATK